RNPEYRMGENDEVVIYKVGDGSEYMYVVDMGNEIVDDLFDPRIVTLVYPCSTHAVV
ncbi:15975_t:CDS:2, partial [Gigaspora rosea]